MLLLLLLMMECRRLLMLMMLLKTMMLLTVPLVQALTTPAVLPPAMYHCSRRCRHHCRR
jgi:hypothetical protein